MTRNDAPLNRDDADERGREKRRDAKAAENRKGKRVTDNTPFGDRIPNRNTLRLSAFSAVLSRNIVVFGEDFPGARTVPVRSTPQVVRHLYLQVFFISHALRARDRPRSGADRAHDFRLQT